MGHGARAALLRAEGQRGADVTTTGAPRPFMKVAHIYADSIRSLLMSDRSNDAPAPASPRPDHDGSSSSLKPRGANPDTTQGALARVLRLWFGFREPVDGPCTSRRASGSWRSSTRSTRRSCTHDARLLVAASYLNPSTACARTVPQGPTWLFATMAPLGAAVHVVGVTMSVRRAVDAGISAWLGVLFIVPSSNYASCSCSPWCPRSEGKAWSPRPGTVYRGADPAPPSLHVDSGVKSALYGVAGAVGLGPRMVGSRSTRSATTARRSSSSRRSRWARSAPTSITALTRARWEDLLVAVASSVIAGSA